jgi:hypothetical protein
MIEPLMLAHTNLDSSRMQTIDVVRSGKFCSKPTRIKTVFERLTKETHRYPTSPRSDEGITDTDVSEPVHRQINLLRLLINLRNGACAVIFGWVHVRH